MIRLKAVNSYLNKLELKFINGSLWIRPSKFKFWKKIIKCLGSKSFNRWIPKKKLEASSDNQGRTMAGRTANKGKALFKE